LLRSPSAGFCLASGGSMRRWSYWRSAWVRVAFAERRQWNATGFVYAAAAQLASILVRFDQTSGFAALMLVLLVVWVTDIGGLRWPGLAAQNSGRGSPKKTWAGPSAGFAASLVIAAGGQRRRRQNRPLVLLGAALSVAFALGDLLNPQ